MHISYSYKNDIEYRVFLISFINYKMWREIFPDLYQNALKDDTPAFERMVLAIHTYNISQELVCTGLSEDDPPSQDMLPSGWNSNPNLYSFRYSHKGNNIYLKAVKINNNTIKFHCLRSDQNDKIHSWTADITNFINNAQDMQRSMILLMNEYIPEYHAQILEKVKPTPGQSRGGVCLLEEQPRRPPYGFAPPGYPEPGPFGGIPFVGQGDLFTPGMFPGSQMGPNHPYFGQPNRRPGYRYDPEVPFSGFKSNPDHFPPPGPGGFGGGSGFP